MNRHLKALVGHYIAKRDEALANLETYLTNPVGVGEHSDLQTEQRRWVQQAADADSNLEILSNYFDSSGYVLDQAGDSLMRLRFDQPDAANDILNEISIAAEEVEGEEFLHSHTDDEDVKHPKLNVNDLE